MMSDYRFILRRTDRIVVVRYIGRGCRDLNRQTVWTLVKSRQPRTCKAIGAIIKTGDWCWSPLTNAVYRGHRISDDGMTTLERRTRRCR